MHGPVDPASLHSLFESEQSQLDDLVRQPTQEEQLVALTGMVFDLRLRMEEQRELLVRLIGVLTS